MVQSLVQTSLAWPEEDCRPRDDRDPHRGALGILPKRPPSRHALLVAALSDFAQRPRPAWYGRIHKKPYILIPYKKLRREHGV